MAKFPRDLYISLENLQRSFEILLSDKFPVVISKLPFCTIAELAKRKMAAFKYIWPNNSLIHE